MKKTELLAWVLVGCMAVVALASLPFLPGQLAIQWNASGVSNTAPKWILFLMPALGAFINVTHKAQLERVKTGMESAYLFALLVLLGGEVVIICNALGLIDLARANNALFIKISCLLLGGVLLWFGNRLPKVAKNYYVGVKAPAAYHSDDLWISTQRFAGKLWVLVGLAIMLLTFAPVTVQSASVLLGAALLVLLPRFYSHRLYAKQAK